MRTIFLFLLFALALTASGAELAVTNGSFETADATSPAKEPYTVTNLEIPPGVVAEAGGITYWPNGDMVYCTRRGEIWTIRDGNWNKFATGLHEPLGIWADTVGEVYVTQRPELTRIRDIDGDGTADRYETVTASWGIPGSLTDFVYGLRRDTKGNFYGTTHTTHGPWAQGISNGSRTKFNFGGPMGAPMIGRGWSFKVDPAGTLTWWSSGLRAPNGLGFNAAGDLFATDNQGDWVGTNALHHLAQGDFHGHPSSYQWDPRRTIEMNIPLPQLATELDKIRKLPAVWFPYIEMGNSPSEPVIVGDNFGPFTGQFLIGDNTQPLITRVCLEKVAGEYQGSCFPFLRNSGLQKAICRMAFAPDGALTLTVGGRGWGPAVTGIQQVTWTGETPFDVEAINLTQSGFRLTFTKPLKDAALSPAAFVIQSYWYAYHKAYGSPKINPKDVTVKSVQMSADRRMLTLTLDPLETRKIYDFTFTGLFSADGESLRQTKAYYTLNRLLPERAATGQRVFFPLCMDTHDAEKRSLADQASLFKELGFDGCGHLCRDLGYGGYGDLGTVEQRAKTLKEQGLRLVQAYGRVRLNSPQPINLKRIEQMMPTLAAHRTQLTLLLLGDRKDALDDKAVATLAAIADIAKPYGVEIVLYPHKNDYVQTVGEAVRIAAKLNRPDAVGVMFTLSHWSYCDPDRDLRRVLKNCAPWLKAVSINGVDEQKQVVLPLTQGNFDVSQVLAILDELDFRGPVGLMCWRIGGDARTHLTSSMARWQEWTATEKAPTLNSDSAP